MFWFQLLKDKMLSSYSLTFKRVSHMVELHLYRNYKKIFKTLWNQKESLLNLRGYFAGKYVCYLITINSCHFIAAYAQTSAPMSSQAALPVPKFSLLFQVFWDAKMFSLNLCSNKTSLFYKIKLKIFSINIQ